MTHQTIQSVSIPFAELMESLLQSGVSYRYAPERFAKLDGCGHPYPSPTRETIVNGKPMIEEAIQPVLSPIVLTGDEAAQLRTLAAAWPRLLQAQMAIYRMARTGQLDHAAALLIRNLCTKHEWDEGLTLPGYKAIHPFVRLDAIKTANGFKVMDINTTRPAGVGDLITATGMLDTVYRAGGLSHYATFDTAGHFAAVVRRCINQWAAQQKLAGESVRLQVVIRSDDGDWHNFATLARILDAAGMPTSVVEPDAIKNGEPTAIIRGRIKEGDPAFDLLLPGYPDERCILAPLYRRFLGNKVWMYLFRIEPFRSIFREQLGDAYHILDACFADIGYVQEDRILLPHGSVQLQHADRHDWVLKDPASSSGQRMVLGYTMSDKKWKQSLWNDVQDGWIAQRFYTNVEEQLVADAEGKPHPLKLFTKYGVYIFGDQLGGLEYHARTHPVVHGARNAYFNPVFYAKTVVP